MSTNLFRNAIINDRARATITLLVTLAALLAMPTAGGFAGLGSSENASSSFDAVNCSASAAQ